MSDLSFVFIPACTVGVKIQETRIFYLYRSSALLLAVSVCVAMKYVERAINHRLNTEC